jgi:hypothetical protein
LAELNGDFNLFSFEDSNLSYRGSKKGSYGKVRSVKAIQADRSKRARSIDAAFKAKIGTPDQWRSDPARYDIDGLDTPNSKKEVFYTSSDFKIVKNNQDPQNPYSFMSKDGRVNANFFFKKDNVELRGLVGNTGLVHIAYPFVNKGGGGIIPKPEEILRTLVDRLNRGEYDH